eukprot:PhM_4_TR7013/c0_g2_i1/m.23074/K16745/B9D2; B9 domain-containing protein 2
MAEVFIIGSLDHATGFGESNLVISFEVTSGSLWERLSGTVAGQTSVAAKSSRGKTHTFAHPLDIHFMTQCIQGWPKIVLRVWQIDSYGRKDFVGYGVAHIPLPSRLLSAQHGGHHSHHAHSHGTATETHVEVPVWKPMQWHPSMFVRTVNYLRQLVMGGAPRLKDDSIVQQGEGRYRLYSAAGGTVHVKMNIMSKNFNALSIAVG